ncbi:spermatogenesis-associated protein 1 isoform X2 [Austrofundulus limnaeus]|uniref:Spermatogenesis-associated protein 1 isoform X2 n=1 Tax=Austrofundulus limnaeus TaxID=52670 RepID=A0A2I4AJ80_AUSLI|nr:PREDICTED: spermatogenesis-associated protein 1 isoform X2 [Austrofundulus limnaeus]
MRQASCKFVELHVLYVPGDQWNVKLNKVPVEATESFISAGFIRAHPDITLKTLRSQLGALFGSETSIKKYFFLRCVGRSLALVKSRQEEDLKVKTFAPPYAAQPELYLLSAEETDSSFCSQSFATDTSSSSPEQQICFRPPKTCGVPTGTKEPVRFPHIPQCSQQPPPPSGLEEEGEDGEEEDQSCSSSEGENEALCSIRREEGKSHNPRLLQLMSLKKVLDGCEADSAQEELCKNTKHDRMGPSGAERDSCFSLTDRKSKDAHTLTSLRSKQTAVVSESQSVFSRPACCTTPPPGLDLASVAKRTTASLVFPANKTLIQELQLVKEERKQLEWTRQQLLRKGKDLLAQNRHRRNQARDSWKKKYFETKKATAPLEDKLRHVKQELDTFYSKVLHQLHARESRGKPRKALEKNEIIIQIMKANCEIDNLRRKVEDAKMKLLTEMKLRKQAATELRALRAELTQKRSQSSHPELMGNTTRDKLKVSSTV